MTPADQINIITGALAGTANKTLLAWAKKHQIASVGLFLGDGDSVKVTQLDEELAMLDWRSEFAYAYQLLAGERLSAGGPAPLAQQTKGN